jgi:endo-1,4-beta-xylanase
MGRSLRLVAGLVSTLLASALVAAAATATGASAPARQICRNHTGSHQGFFFSVWKDGGDACVTLRAKGRYTTRYDLAGGRNMVVGKGWRTGSPTRKIGYRAAQFDAGANSYLTLYGWSVDPLVEYYVIESWGTAFRPPGPDARAIGTVTSDGGTYEIYRTQRVNQPSIRGRRTFTQYWSVRTERRPIGQPARITFANHVRAWRKLGMTLGRMDYQLMATEGFGSKGGSDVTVWRE